jgi:hypothetical protein
VAERLSVKLRSEAFDFFLESKFALFEFCQRQIVGERSMEFVVNEFFEFMMLFREFLDMRL